jgi:ABC-2 type transport system permease protein
MDLRYVRLLLAFAKFDLAGEMAFRINFLVKLVVEALWLAILILFYNLIFARTKDVAGWDHSQYLFFVGCHYALAGVIETFFLSNCTGYADLIRSGDLDLYLVKPIDEQFLISCRHVDWSAMPNILQGAGVMIWALVAMDWEFTLARVVLFLIVFLAGVALSYSFLLMLCSLSVWLVRNQSLLESWWLFTSLMRYPRDVFTVTSWGSPLGWFFTFVVPILLVVNVPADTMVRAFEPGFITGVVLAAIVMLFLSRAFFRKSLLAYRSASS